MKRLMIGAVAVTLAGCMATTISKDYSADEVKRGEKLPFNKVENLDDIELLDKSAIPVVVKSESKKEQIHSPGGIHGLLWLCTLGIIPSWQTEAETHTMSVATPLGERNGVCTVTKRQYLGWVPYMLPFSSSEEDVQCEDELLSRLVSQYKKEWTAENVSKINAANSERIKKLRAKADELLSKKKYAEVLSICNAEKNKAFVSEYKPKALAVRLSVLKQEVETAMQAKDYQRIIDLCKDEKNDSELVLKRNEATVNLISSCDDAAKLDSLMKKYRDGLSTAQLTEISQRATNDVVKEKLVEMADEEIVKQIKLINKGRGDYDFFKSSSSEQQRRNAHYFFGESSYIIGTKKIETSKEEVEAGKKRFFELFSNVQSPRIRAIVLNEIAIPLMLGHGGLSCMVESGDDFARRLIQTLSPEEILVVYEANGKDVRGFRRLFESYIPSDKLLKCYDVFVAKGIYPDLHTICIRMQNDSDVRKLMARLDANKPLDQYMMRDLCENAQSTEFVDELFYNWKIEVGNKEVVQKFITKLGTTTKSRILAEARKRADEKKGSKIVFGPFYMGMSYLDAILLAEDLGIADDVKICYDPKKNGSYGIRDSVTVWRIDFGNRAKFKFIDCDDEAVLDQIIHQFVKGRSGKVNKFYYNEETRVEDDERIGVCFGYSNTKLGTKVLFNNDSGKLSLVEL